MPDNAAIAIHRNKNAAALDRCAKMGYNMKCPIQNRKD